MDAVQIICKLLGALGSILCAEQTLTVEVTEWTNVRHEAVGQVGAETHL